MTLRNHAEILILDDDPAHAASVQALLALHDRFAEAEVNATSALARLEQGDYPLLILDLNMPLMSGLEVLQRLRDADSRVKTIVLSGESTLEAVAPVLRLGAFDYLPKPFDPQQLLSSVNNALAQVRLERENRAMAAQVRADQALHAFMVDASPDPVYMLDAHGCFSYANRRFHEVFSVSDPLPGRPWTAAVGDDLAALLRCRFNERRTADRARQHFEFHFQDAEGSERFFDLAATGLYEPATTQGARRFVGTYGVLRDLTAQRAAEAHRLDLQNRLQQTSKMEAIGQIAGGIAHDFNNILASIVGYAELVRNAHDRLSPAQITTYLDEVIAAGHRARDLIAQMLSFTRASRGAAQPVNMGDALQDVSRMLRAAIPGAIELRTRLCDDAEPVFADPVQLQQIIINLLVNARDAIDGPGLIEVALSRAHQIHPCAACGGMLDGEHMVFSVADSGHGIDDDTRARMFDMYFTTREPGKGTGIGLGLVNKLIHEYDGHITVNSAPGQGARFDVHFPISGAADPQRIAPLAVTSRIGRIVLVDDEVSVANFMSEVLRDAGYEVVMFTESLQALRYLEHHHASVAAVLTDQQMPLMTGIALAERVRELRPDLPIALVSALVDGQSVSEPLFDRALVKPFRIDELIGMLEELLAATLPAPEMQNPP